MGNRRLQLILGGCVLLALVALAVWFWHSGSSSQTPPGPEALGESQEGHEEPAARTATVRIEGRVYDKGGAPVPGAVILLRHIPKGGESEADMAQCASDQGGSYSFAPDRLGQYTLSVAAAGFAARHESISIANEGTHTVNFCLERSCVIAGQVVAEGGVTPQHVKVRCTSKSEAFQDVTLNLDDSCRFSQAFPPGDYTLRCISGVADDSSTGSTVRFAVRRDNREALRLLPSDTLAIEHAVTLREGKDVDDLLILLPKRNNRVGGRTLNQHNAPVHNAYLALWHENRRIGSAHSDAQGRFLFEHLDVPEETTAVHLSVVATPCVFDRLPTRQEVALGQMNVVVLIERAQQSVEYTLKGRVVDRQTGQGIAGAAIRRDLHGHRPVHSGRSGYFDVAMHLAPDRVHALPLLVEAAGYMGRRLAVDTDPGIPSAAPVILPLDQADSELTIHLCLPEGVSPEQVVKASAEMALSEEHAGAPAGSIPLMDWQRAGGVDKDPLALTLSKEVASGEYPVLFHTWYSCSLGDEEQDHPPMAPRIHYLNVLVEDIRLHPGQQEYDVHVSGNAVLELLLPGVPIKEVYGKIWHSSRIVEADSSWDKLLANNGHTQFTYLKRDGEPVLDTSVPLRLPALPAGAFMLDLLVRPEHGEPVNIQAPVNLEDNRTTTIGVE